MENYESNQLGQPYELFAEYYDAIYSQRGKDYKTEADRVTSLIRDRNPAARMLLDVGCGTGTHLEYLSQSFQCTGADPSTAMLEVARNRLPAISLIVADAASSDLGGTYDAIVCLFSSIAYTRTSELLAASLRNLAAHLRPGGVLIVDGWVPRHEWDSGFVAVDIGPLGGGGRVVRVNHSGEEDGCSVLSWHFVVVTPNDGIRWFEESHLLGLFESDDYIHPLEDSGLSVEVLEGDAEGRDRFVAVRRN